MGKTIADSFREEGEARGEAQGLVKGRVEGRAQGSRETILRLARRRFGEPDSATLDALQAIVDLDRLVRITDRVLDAESWADLLSTL